MSIIAIPARSLVILVGPSGCGKSTFAQQNFRASEVVSSDRCRWLVSDDEANQVASRAAFTVFHTIIRGRLSLGRVTVADATNLRPGARAELRVHAEESGAPVVALVFDVPVDLCLERNQARERRVGPEAIIRQFEQFERAKTLLPEEGYAAVHTVRPDARIRVLPRVVVPPRPPIPEGGAMP